MLIRLSYANLLDRFPEVIFYDPSTVYAEDIRRIKIGEGTIVEPCVKLTGNIEIGKNCRLLFGLAAHNVVAGNNCSINGLLTDVAILDRVTIGRYAEIVRAYICSDVVIKHHCYLGDVWIGNGVNIGAGTITSNFDGKKKNITVICRNSFVGTNVDFVAKTPSLTVGENAFIAAGLVIRRDIPPDTFVRPRTQHGEDIEFLPNKKQKVGRHWV